MPSCPCMDSDNARSLDFCKSADVSGGGSVLGIAVHSQNHLGLSFTKVSPRIDLQEGRFRPDARGYQSSQGSSRYLGIFISWEAGTANSRSLTMLAKRTDVARGLYVDKSWSLFSNPSPTKPHTTGAVLESALIHPFQTHEALF